MNYYLIGGISTVIILILIVGIVIYRSRENFDGLGEQCKTFAYKNCTNPQTYPTGITTHKECIANAMRACHDVKIMRPNTN